MGFRAALRALDEEFSMRYPARGAVPMNLRLMLLATFADMTDWNSYSLESLRYFASGLDKDDWYSYMVPILRAARDDEPRRGFVWWMEASFPWEEFEQSAPEFPKIDITGNLGNEDGLTDFLRRIKMLRPGKMTRNIPGTHPAGWMIPMMSAAEVREIARIFRQLKERVKWDPRVKTRNDMIERLVSPLDVYSSFERDWESLGKFLYKDARVILREISAAKDPRFQVSFSTVFTYAGEHLRQLAKDAAGAAGEVAGEIAQTAGEALGQSVRGFFGATGLTGLAFAGLIIWIALK